jgi:hypothetical protein
MAILHFAAVVTPKNPNSNAQHSTEKPLTTQGFQLPKSAKLPTPINTIVWIRNVKPVAIKMTDVYSLV